MVAKDMTFKLQFCEGEACMNRIGHAGCMAESLATGQRKILCLECKDKNPMYMSWATLVYWK